MLSQEQRQQQCLGQQQMQALAVLSLDGVGLEELLKQEEVDNPVFDLEKIAVSRRTPAPDTAPREEAVADKTQEDLRLMLESQLPADADAEDRRLFARMTEFLESGTGLLPESVQEISEILAAPLYRVERCLSWMHQMEPAGVGAATTAESLVLQAYHRQMVDPKLYDILFDHLEDLAARRYRRIMRACGLTLEQVEDYAAQIRTLEPYPTAEYGGLDTAAYIVPDLVFAREKDGWTVQVRDRWSGGVPYSELYTTPLADAAPELRSYLQAQRRHAEQIVRCVERRRQTLCALGRCIVQTQQDFLERGEALHTLTADQLAAETGLNPSTVSRALKGKYVQTPDKVYPLTFFLSRAGSREAGGESRSEILAALSGLLAQEDAAHPLSDAQLVDALGRQGITVSRRTVAKYRLFLGVPGAAERKR